MLQIYTGNGKGKTTAALGLAVRAVGAGKKAAIVYFDKGGEFYSERPVLQERFRGDIEIFVTGLERFDPKLGTFRFGVTEDDRVEAERGLMVARDLLEHQRHDLVVLDEIVSSLDTGAVTLEQVMRLVDARPDSMELVLTGRGCPPELRKRADLVSEIKDVKHYLRKGVKARKGIDF
jgi:cob(I)alamin adenosyltransferase